MIHPDVKPGERIRLKHRGDGANSKSLCQMSPKDDEEILFLGDAIIFEWGMASETFIFKLWNTSDNQLVETSETKNNSYQIPLTKLEPDASYEWTITGKDGKQVCQALFSTLSKDESNEIKTNLEALSDLLPQDIREENKLLLQSGYLISEGLYFNADRFFENKGF